MRAIIDALGAALGTGFLVLAAVAARDARRRADRARPVLSGAFAALGGTLLLIVLNDLLEPSHGLLSAAILLLFVTSGLLMLTFRHSFIPLSPRARYAALFASIVAVTVTLTVRPMFGPDPDRGPAEAFAILGVLTIWAGFLTEPAIRLWIASRTRPAVQRSRLRSLSSGYAGLVVAAIAGVVGRLTDRPEITLGATVAAVLLLPVISAGFAPPQWLRRAWRAREEESFNLGRELTVFAIDRPTIAERALDRALRLAGAESGFVLDSRGTGLALRGMNEEEAGRLEARARTDAALVPLEDGRRFAIVARPEWGSIGVVSGPFTPLFGSDELIRLTEYADLVGIALERVRLVETQARERERFEKLLMALSDLDEGFVVTDAGRLVYANDAYCRMTGYTLGELEALPSLLELSHPDERAEIAERLRRRIAGGEVKDRYEGRLIRKDGEILTVDAAVKLLVTEEGLRVVSIVRDVTERSRAQASIERKSESIRLLHSVAVAANSSADPENAFAIALAEVCRFSGWRVGHVYAVDPDAQNRLIPMDVWHLDEPDRFEAFVAATRNSTFALGEGLPGRVLQEGGPIWIQDLGADGGFVRPIDSPSRMMSSAVAFPVFARDEVVAVIEFFDTRSRPEDPELLEIMSQVGTQLGRAVERRRIESFRDRFIANAAHELRTPVATLVGFATLLSDHRDTLSPEDLDELADGLGRQGSRMNVLVNNLLDISRLQQGRVDLSIAEVDLHEALDDTLSTTPAPGGKHVKLVVESRLAALADRAKLDQIVTNLLTNAYRYGGDSIVVEAKREGGRAVISVRDDGPGVTSDVLPHLFDPFSRGATSSRVGGSGLGLAIVRMLVRAHGGDIVYDRASDRGSTFSFDLAIA